METRQGGWRGFGAKKGTADGRLRDNHRLVAPLQVDGGHDANTTVILVLDPCKCHAAKPYRLTYPTVPWPSSGVLRPQAPPAHAGLPANPPAGT